MQMLKVSQNRIAKLKTDGLNDTEIAHYLNVGRMTVFRHLQKTI